ncbi:MAG: sigma-E factor regulatory protein RseB [Pasteurellaceae bacterium]|nr:sigma-E factor regulatory protein RseB [Pasteurellaceae bacterium]
MRKISSFLTAVFCFFFVFPVFAVENSAPLTPKQLLENMTKASDNLNYELIYVQASPLDLDSFRYRHLNIQKRTYALLDTLDDSKQEIVQRDNLISYFQQNSQPFTINSSHIIDNLPSVMHADFNQLANYYDFIDKGRGRIADRPVQLINIKPKDDFRYQFLAFIDAENHLLLRCDMLDHEGNQLEQFRVVNLYVGDGFKALSDYLNAMHFPPLLTNKNAQTEKATTDWHTNWLPQGFKLINQNSNNEENGQDTVTSQLYSDGLFSFTVYVANKLFPNEQDNLWKQGANIIYNENRGEKELTIIGQIPTSTAKRIVQNIQFNQ